MAARGEVACGDGGGGSYVSARGATVTGEPGTEVRCGPGSVLQMPSTPVPMPVPQGHEVKVQGGHSLAETDTPSSVDVNATLSSTDVDVPHGSEPPAVVPTTKSSTQLDEQFVFNAKYGAWMPSSANPDEWANVHLVGPPPAPAADDWELV